MRADGCTCPKQATEHLAGCPVQPLPAQPAPTGLHTDGLHCAGTKCGNPEHYPFTAQPAPTDRPVVLFDVDGVLTQRDGTPTPGIARLVDVLQLLGFEVRFWSAGGVAHIGETLAKVGIYGMFTLRPKPEYPIAVERAVEAIGGRVALQIDDDPTERVGDWPFMQWDPVPESPAQPAPTGPVDMEAEAGRLLVASAKLRVERAGPGDAHELRHLWAAINAGNSDPCGESGESCHLDAAAIKSWSEQYPQMAGYGSAPAQPAPTGLREPRPDTRADTFWPSHVASVDRDRLARAMNAVADYPHGVVDIPTHAAAIAEAYESEGDGR